ncbi:MAG: hypothetical protein IJ160_00610 [Muribaculaceae bacterium]|nr:hypothetical protein [Muribaculaceae bacterium]
MKQTLSTVLCLLCALLAHSGHIMIDGAYTSPDGTIFPGTTRTYQVYVPDQYDGRTPACLYVGLDGVLCNAPQVMDSLITAGKMPVTIGIFLQPGVISDTSGEVIRYNRSNEFDTPDATFARFLEQQLLPHALARTVPDGRRLKISPLGNDHMIAGLSSGGIAAFTAAWHRPDLFSRVFSGVGTFVAMRGGNDLQAIVRKHEPQPLRIFLQDGSNDAWNPLFGHWYEGNRMLATALEFAGYDCRFDWSDGGHNVHRATQIFAQAMEWMWHDWPQPISAGITHNDFLAPLLVTGAQWVKGPPVTPGVHPTFPHYPDSSFCVLPGRDSNKLDQAICDTATGQMRNRQPFYWLHSYTGSNVNAAAAAFDHHGNLWVVTHDGLQICDQNGRVRAIIALPETVTEHAQVIIHDGSVSLCTPLATYTRRFHVKPATPGVRPSSQGQG